MPATTTRRTGHFAQFQMVTACEPSPTASPTAWASEPVRTIAIATSANSTVMKTVTRIWRGRSFQKGRPSRFS